MVLVGSEETGPIHQLQFSILKDEVTLMLDTSGAGLHKRGYRANSLAAPIKETLAAGMIELARVRKDNLLLDPFCGSGTFLIEATLRARNIAPGINRTFAAEKWDEQFHTVFRQARSDAMDAVERNSEYAAVGYDIDPAAVELTMENAKKAGIRANVRASVQDIGSFQMPEEKATVITNHPMESVCWTSVLQRGYTVPWEGCFHEENMPVIILSALMKSLNVFLTVLQTVGENCIMEC